MRAIRDDLIAPIVSGSIVLIAAFIKATQFLNRLTIDL